MKVFASDRTTISPRKARKAAFSTLALPRRSGDSQEPDPLVREAANDVRRGVAAAVRGDHDLEAVGWIVERQRVGDALGNDLFLVVRGDEHETRH